MSAKGSVELTGYAKVSADGSEVKAKTLDAPTPPVMEIPIPLDANGNPMSYEDASTALEYWTMSFMNPIFHKGFTEEGLSMKDLGKVSEGDKSNNLYNRFWEQWLIEIQKPKKKRSLWLTLWRTAGYCRVLYGLGLYAIFSALGFIPVLVLNKMLKHFEGISVMTDLEVWVCAGLMLIVPIVSSLLAVQSNTLLAHIGVDFRNCLINAIFRKSMVLSPASRQEFSTGQIVNMFSTDTRQIQAFLFFMNNVVLAPAQIAVAIYLIYGQVQTATFVGLGFMMVMMPLNGVFFKYLTIFRKLKVAVTDRRVKLMNEVLAGIRIIKYYAWELAFEGQITSIRDEEMVYLKKIAYLVACGFTLVLMAVPLVQPIIVFFTYVQLGNELTATVAFTTIALFNVMQLPFAFLPMGLQQFSQSLVSCDRMVKFFESEELEEYVDRGKSTADEEGKPESEAETAIVIENASFFWVKETEELLHDEEKRREDSMAVKTVTGDEVSLREGRSSITDVDAAKLLSDTDSTVEVGINRSCHTLMDININIRKGQLVAVVGSVGSGKSSLLQALLGEMICKVSTNTKVAMNGSVAYCAQQPWILNETVRENVLFGREYDESLFDAAVHSSSLEDDIRILPGGVLTEIGEKGINLSGGQKARVSLARAVYRQADVYLLDDPLSAVDAHVGQHLFKECIQKQLAGKTRILVTHHVHLLPLVDHIIILDDGKIKAQGTYAELQKSGIAIEEFVRSAKAPEEEECDLESEGSAGRRSRSGSATSATSATSAKSESEKPKTEQAIKAEIRHADTRKSALMSLEERKLGDVETATYMYYLRSGGLGWFVGGLSFQCVSQMFNILSFFWLGEWGKESAEEKLVGEEMSTNRSMWYLRWYSLLTMLGLLCTFTRALMIAQHRVKTSSVLHSDLLRVVCAAPVWFFDTTPLGRILNRFSSDMQVVDEELSQTIGQITNSLFNVGGALLGVVAATKGTFLIIMIPLFFMYRRVQGYFRKTNTTIARLASVSLSPVYAEFSQAIAGGGTISIRAYNEKMKFTTRLEEKVDKNTVAMVMQQLAGQWLAIRLDIMGATVSCFIAVVTVAFRDQNFIPAGWLGLGMTYSFMITTFMKFCVRVMATGEAQMNAVERIMFYCENMEQEEYVVANTTGESYTIVSADAWNRKQTVESDIEKASLAVKVVPEFEAQRLAKLESFGIYKSLLESEAEAYQAKNWPTEGKIEFRDVSMAYHTGPLVLKNLSKCLLCVDCVLLFLPISLVLFSFVRLHVFYFLCLVILYTY